MQVPTSRAGEALQVLEVASGPNRTNLGVPDEPVISLLRTDINQAFPIDRVLNAAGRLPDDLVGSFDTIIINNPYGFNPNLAQLGRALREGERIIIQGSDRNLYFNTVAREAPPTSRLYSPP